MQAGMQQLGRRAPAQLGGGGRRSGARRHGSLAAARAESGSDQGAKTALVTGANTGIGLITARELAAKGYTTTLACRDAAKAQVAKDTILAAVPGAKVEVAALDLADLDSVRAFASRVLDSGRPVDVLVNNAGVMACPQLQTAQGHELQLGVNHLGHFLLTSMLAPLLTDPTRAARVVNVASSAHLFGTMNFDDLMSRRNYQPWVAYGQSKLANVLFTYELARRLPPAANCTANALHPGVVKTELSRYLFDPAKAPWWQLPLLGAAGLFLKTPEQGAATSIHLAASPQVEGLSSKYWVDCKPATSSKESYDAEVARKLWEVSVELTGAPELQLAPAPVAAAAQQ